MKNLEVYRLLFAQRKPILVFTGVMIFASVIFTMPFFITPLFKSEAIISPSSTNSGKIFIERDPKFGDDRDIDQQAQILRSATVRDSMIKRFHLIEKYEIDTSHSSSWYELYKEYEERLVVDRTRYNAISITVYDASPDSAAAMANALIGFADKVKNSIIKNNQKLVLQSIEKKYFDKKTELDSKALALNKAEASNLVSGSVISNMSDVLRIKEQMDVKTRIQQMQNSNQNNAKLLQLIDYDRMLEEFLDLESNYRIAFSNASSDVPSSFIISPAEVINKKAKPYRSLIVCITALISFLIACAYVIASEKVSGILSEIKR